MTSRVMNMSVLPSRHWQGIGIKTHTYRGSTRRCSIPSPPSRCTSASSIVLLSHTYHTLTKLRGTHVCTETTAA